MIPKYRAFLKDTKQIAKVDSIFFESEVAKVTNNEFYQFNDIALMQSTGLKDKNGVEIFDGDIVNYKSVFRNPMTGRGNLSIDRNFEIIFRGGRFAMKDIDIDISRSSENIEVIGNIHENADLLEEK